MSYIPINFTYYNPKTSFLKSDKSERERYTVYTCCNTENCEAYKNGKCIMLNGLWGQRCPYGAKQIEEGYTKAARKCGELVSKAKAKHENIAYALKPLEFPCNIGEYVYLHLPYLCNYVNPIRGKDFFFSEGLMIKNDFTPEFVVELIKFEPKALMGGIISEYQKKCVPLFVRRLRQHMPDMYNAVQEVFPEIDSFGTLENMNFVGKRALVKTLLPCKIGLCGQVHIAEWDGNVIQLSGKDLGWRLNGDEKVTINPNDNTYVTVMDNDSVTENTIFEE